MRPPTWPLTDVELRRWVDEACALTEDDGSTPWPERLAHLHAAFERVHPFLDGNGRTGRLVLVRMGYPPLVVLKQHRPAYLAVLARADAGDDGPLGEIVARAITENLNRSALPAVAGPARLVPLAALVTSDLSLAALRQAAQRGRLEAHQGDDGTCVSSGHAVERYRASRGQRRPRATDGQHPTQT